MEKHKAAAILIQETHSLDIFKFYIIGYKVIISQDRPPLFLPVNPARSISNKAVKTYNIRKSSKPKFTCLVNDEICLYLPEPTSVNLDTFYISICKVLLRQQKKTFLSLNRQLIPTWYEEYDSCYKDFISSTTNDEATKTNTDLLQSLCTKGNQCW